MRKIWDVRGIRVPGNGNRNGRRAVDSVDHNVERRGGAYRPLGPSPSRRPLHADAEKAQKERMGLREAAFTEWKAQYSCFCCFSAAAALLGTGTLGHC